MTYTPPSYSARYTFSGKEKDSETGLNYFGSRYYSSDLSIWLSVDPMSDKYPSLSPYAYCAGNPVKLVDPNGEDVEDWVKTKDGKIHYDSRVKDQTTAEKYYGKGATHLYQGQEINTTNGRMVIKAGNKYWLNGKVRTAKDSAPWYSSAWNSLLSGMHKLDGGGHSAESNEWVGKAEPVVTAVATAIPIVSQINDGKTLFTGKDMYGNPASTKDRVVAGISLVSGGVSKVATKGLATVAKTVNTVSVSYTILSTYDNEKNKK